jgi:hypothetical protein
VSLYVALFQKWNKAHFPVSIMLMRDELMAAAHIGSRATYLTCLRDLDKWKFLTYLPSQSPHKASCAIMHEQTSLEIEVGSADQSTMLKSEPSSGPSCEPTSEQVVSQAAGPINKTFENRATSQNFSNFTTAGSKKKEGLNVGDEWLSEEQLDLEECNDSKEKVAQKRKVRVRNAAQDRPVRRPEVPFSESDLADLDSFIAAFAGTDFELANLRYYHEKVANWRKNGEPPRRRDWKATTKTFMLNDIERNALVLAPGSQVGSTGANPNPSSTGTGAYSAGYVSQRYS